jgi:hypothetical protein
MKYKKEEKILFLILKKEWFFLIKKGKKNIEYREKKPYWEKRFIKNNKLVSFDNIFFRKGYTKNFLKKRFIKMDIINGLQTDLKIDKDVFAISFK